MRMKQRYDTYRFWALSETALVAADAILWAVHTPSVWAVLVVAMCTGVLGMLCYYAFVLDRRATKHIRAILAEHNAKYHDNTCDDAEVLFHNPPPPPTMHTNN